MIRVAHLTNDTALGGVTCMLNAMLGRLDECFVQSLHTVDPDHSVPPRVAADVIVIHFTLSWRKLSWLLGLRLRNRGAAFILVEHSYTKCFEALYVRHRGRFRLLLRLSAMLMWQVVAVSQAQCTWLHEDAGIAPHKLTLINPLTILSHLRDLPLPSRQSGPLRICGYGRYAQQKGFDTLVIAMRLISPDVASLRLVGLGPEEAVLRRCAEGLPHVSIEGPSSGPAEILQTVDAVIMPSRFEAYGIVAAEACAAGRPILVSTVDGLLNHALPMQELTVPPEDPVALARAIVWLAAQDITALGAVARNAVEGSEERTLCRWNALLARAAETRQQRRATVQTDLAAKPA